MGDTLRRIKTWSNGALELDLPQPPQTTNSLERGGCRRMSRTSRGVVYFIFRG